MKRVGGLFARIVSFENLLRAQRRAARGKRGRPSVARFEFHLERELIALQQALQAGDYHPGEFFSFEVRDPKRRAICAAPFRDRVVHHAVCDVLEPVLDRRLIFDSYACRHGKGTHAAISRAQQFSRRYRFVLQCDVRRFFASVDHAVLRRLLARLFREPPLLALLDRIIEQGPPGAAAGRGLPIGNLSSQHFANLYLGELDHHLKDRRRVPGYVRYMDDLLLFADDKAELHRYLAEIRRFLAQSLRLELKERATRIAPVSEGIGYLGFLIYPGTVRLNQRSRRRFFSQMQFMEGACQSGQIDPDALCCRAASLFAHVGHADTWRLRRRVLAANMVSG